MHLEEFEGRYDVIRLAETEVPANGTALAARSAILASGPATDEDALRWDDARARVLADPEGRDACIPIFRATARRVA